MGCEGFGAGQDVTMMAGDTLMMIGDGRHANDVQEKRRSPEPPNNFWAGDKGN